MLHKRNDSSLKSVPVSRVSSSQRLSQLVQQQPNSFTSIPSTPSTYVTSSLNPSRHLPITPGNYRSKITNKEELERFEKLPVVQHVNELEKLLNELSGDISSFKEESIVDTVKDMINVNDALKEKINGLEQHRKLGEEIKHLTTEQTQLNDKSKHILIELIAFRNELKSLPKLPAAGPAKVSTDKEAVEVSVILKYAMKLAKFTKAPATIGNAPFQVHPNNYVWPAEDALRRGMLAASSLQEEEIIKNELRESGSQTEDAVAPTETSNEVTAKEPAEKSSPRQGRRGSFGNYGAKVDAAASSAGPATNNVANVASEKKADESVDLDLDLFDPDDEFSD